MMLDPKRTGKISLALTLNFLKFSNLRSPDINKIMKYCKKDSTRSARQTRVNSPTTT